MLIASQKCSDEVRDCVPELQDGFAFGQKLLEDDDLTEEDKEAVRKDIQDLRDQFIEDCQDT